MKLVKCLLVMACLFLMASSAHGSAKVIRATAVGASLWSDLASGKLGNIIVEFRQGDELPVTFEAQGDLIESKQTAVNFIEVKRNFWLQLKKSTVEISLDGVAFKKLSDVLTGSLEAGARAPESGGIAESINIVFKAFLK